MITVKNRSLPEPGAGRTLRPRDVPMPNARICLQPRDVQMLIDLHQYGCMLRGQLQALYFGSVQRTNMRLRQLFDSRYIDRLEVPLPSYLTMPAACQSVYRLGYAGIPIVAAATGVDAADIRRQLRTGTASHLLHSLEIVSLRLAVEVAVRIHTDVRLEAFLPERLCQHSYDYRARGDGAEREGQRWRREVYKPDAVLLLAWSGGAAGYAVEIDLGHTSAGEFLTKSRIHARYANSGLFAGRYGREKAGTLCLTTSAKRRDNLRALLAKEDNHCFLFSTFSEVREGGAFGSVWRRAGEETPVSLLPLVGSFETTEQS